MTAAEDTHGDAALEAWAAGWGAAVLGQAILFLLLPPDPAWRGLFALGALPALLVFYLRRSVDEPEVARTTRAVQAAQVAI